MRRANSVHCTCDWSVFVIWCADSKIVHFICTIRVQWPCALCMQTTTQRFIVYFVNNRLALFAQSQSHAAAKLRFHLQNKVEIIVIYKARLQFFGKQFFPSVVCVCQLEMGKARSNYRHCFSSPIRCERILSKLREKQQEFHHCFLISLRLWLSYNVSLSYQFPRNFISQTNASMHSAHMVKKKQDSINKSNSAEKNAYKQTN